MRTALRFRALWLGVAPVALVGLGAPAQAQGIFCPSSVGSGTTGITLSGGFCTNVPNGGGPGTGAFSNAALASQALSDVTQASSQQSTDTVVQAVSARRRTEQVQQETPPSAPRVRKLPPREPSQMPTKAEPIAPVPYGPQWGVWAEGFGEYDRLTGEGVSSTAIVPIGLTTPMNLSFTTKATTGGFVAGADRTFRNFGPGGGTLITGVLTGYLWSNLSSSTTSAGSAAAGIGPGTGTLSGHLSGPSVGAYATYVLNGFSTDLTLKVDFLHLNETFTDALAFSPLDGNPNNPVGTKVNTGTGSTNLINYGIAWNIQQKFFLSNATWIEPTAGIRYYIADYDSDAAALGLADGHVLRLQAGARLGTQFFWNNVLVTPVLTGLVYGDPIVSGLALTDAAFIGAAGGVASAATEGKVRGQGIGAVKFDYGNGLSSFVQADVRGGSDYFGYGGRAGVRFVW